MNTTILNEVKTIGCGDYNNADAMTQEAIENDYINYIATSTRYTPKPLTVEEKQARHFESTKKLLEKYERNGWTLSKELQEFKTAHNL